VKLKIVIDGKTYDVDVEVEDSEQPIYGVGGYVPMSPARIPTPVPVRAPEGAPTAPEGDDKVCRSPISGIVVRVTAEVGQQIQEGDTIMVLEAMKMETDITASAEGKVRRINAKAGDSVQGGQILVEFE
jgi:methylmalonyl-CoA carboxyltransferase small subunit